MIKFDYLLNIIPLNNNKSNYLKIDLKCSDCEGRSQIGGQK